MKVMLFWVSQFIGINGGIEKVFSNLLMRWFGAGILWIWYIVQKNMENYIHLYTSIDSKINLINLADYLPGYKFESARPISMKILREFWRIVDRNHMASFVRSFEVKYICNSIKELLEMSCWKL